MKEEAFSDFILGIKFLDYFSCTSQKEEFYNIKIVHKSSINTKHKFLS